MDEQPDEELHQTRNGWVPGSEAPVPNLELTKRYSSGIFMEASSHRHNLLLTLSPTPLLSPEDGG